MKKKNFFFRVMTIPKRYHADTYKKFSFQLHFIRKWEFIKTFLPCDDLLKFGLLGIKSRLLGN